MKNVLLTILFLLFIGKINAQSNISASFIGLTMHPGGDRTAEYQPYKLDKNAWFVFNFGGVINYEKFIWEKHLSVGVLQAFFADCSFGMASVTHIGIKAYFIKKDRHMAGLQIGPAFMVREDWNRLEGYESSGTLKTHDSKILGPVQYRFFPIGGMLEYSYKLNEHWDFCASLTPGPFAFTSGIGLKYWFDRDFEKKLHLPKVK